MPSAETLVGGALHFAKRSVRERIGAQRDALDPAYRQTASAAIVARLAALPSFAAARELLLTLPFRSEWDTRALIEAAAVLGKTIVLPRVDGTSRMLDLHRIGDVERDVVPGYQGIPEPLASLPKVNIGAIDWVLVPGLAFDLGGARLGYGGGFYDRMLAQLSPGTPRVAGAFALQIIDTVPAAPHDLVVDVIATESGLIVTRPAARPREPAK